MAISSLESLRTHLQWAIELEHATLAPYLSALYSIKPGTNVESVEVIKSVFIEEMLHMALAANILNAIGGTPRFDYDGFIPTFPTPLPHGDGSFLVHLGKFTPEGVRSFLNIERPAETDTEPLEENYHSIGQFYAAIIRRPAKLLRRAGRRQSFLRQSVVAVDRRNHLLRRGRSVNRGHRPRLRVRGDGRKSSNRARAWTTGRFLTATKICFIPNGKRSDTISASKKS